MNFRSNKFGLRAGVTLASSVVVLSGALASQRLLAQEGEILTEEVVVMGVRTSLENAQDIKRDADTFVDSISSSDIGALPDRSVLEAMQRIPGVSIERFQAANDPDHFGVEGSGAVIRGMTQTRSEFNGRDSFTANSGRGLSFQDVPPELMGGVDTYKNQTADMIEGGIGGTVNLRTRKPFDNRNRIISVSGDLTYGDMVEKTTPTISGLFSNTWETDVGEFGFLLNVSNSELRASSHGIQTDLFEYRSTAPRGTDVDPNQYRGFPNAAEAGFDNVWVPNGANLTMKVDDRTRRGLATAFQWENPDDTMVATVQFMRSDATLAWNERAIKYQSGYNQDNIFPPDSDTFGGEYEFDENGIFTNGVFTHVSEGWRGDGDRIPHYNANWIGAEQRVRHFGTEFQTDTRYKNTRTIVDDLGLNLSWDLNPGWNVTLDLQHIEATTDDDDVALMLGTKAIQDYDLRGSNPTLGIYQPWTYYEPTLDDTGEPVFYHEWAGNENYLQDTTSYFWRSAQDHYERSEGTSDAVRLDFTNYLEGDFFTQLKFGARHAQRDQKVRSTAYNWGQLQAPWGPPIYNYDDDGQIILIDDDPENPSTVYPGGAGWLDTDRVGDAGLGGMSHAEYVSWDDFFRGGVVQIQGRNDIIHPGMNLVRDYHNWGERLAPISNEWLPANARDEDLNGVIDNIPGTYFLPGEINDVSETNSAVYFRLDFEGDMGRRYMGNFGLRYVKIDHEISGSVIFPDYRPQYPISDNFNMEDYLADPVSYNVPGLDPRAKGDYRNFLSDDLRQFANGASIPGTYNTSESHLLPSFNLKVELTDELIGRFAVGKAIALPDMEDLRAYKQIGVIGYTINSSYFGGLDDVPGDIRPVDPDSIVFNGWRAEGGNPELKAMESVQFDLSLEWYFARVGSLTTSYFYKDLKNFFVRGGEYETFTNPNGASQQVISAMTRNQGAGKMQGVEIAYQQFFDMLPEPWDSLGIQLNYSYIDAEGTPNYNDVPEDVERDSDPEAAPEVTFTNLPLRGQSKDTANAILMYENDTWSARVAYNWRSEYLLTTRDTITKLPIFNSDAGFMDASLFYNINDSVKIGLQGVNLLNTQTETFAQIDNDGTRVGRSWFVNDRRYSLVVRANF